MNNKVYLGGTCLPIYYGSSRPKLSLSALYSFTETDNPWYEAPWFDDAVSPSYSSFANLQSAINAAGSGDTIDFAGARYELQAGDIGADGSIWTNERVNISSKNLTLRNLTIDGSRELTWSETSPGSQIYEASIGLGNYETQTQSLCLRITDRMTRDAPLMLVTPTAPTENPELTYSRFSLNANWHTVVAVGSTSVGGSVFTDDAPTTPRLTNNNEYLYGFRVSDATMRSEVLSNLTAFANVRDCIIYYWSANNIVAAASVESYTDDGTNLDVVFRDMPTLRYNGYFSFSMSRPRSSLVAGTGEYCIEPYSGKVVYAPDYGSAPAARLPRAEVLFRINSSNVAFEGCKFVGVSPTGTAGAAISGQNSSTVSMQDCAVGLCAVACRDAVFTIDNCSFDTLTLRGIAGYDGTTVTNSRFARHELASAILVLASGTAASDPIAKTTISGCFFNLASAVHGQAVSLYNDAWQSGDIHGNIFYNCQTTLSFQPRSSTQLTAEHSMIISNNLFVQTYEATNPSQWAISWNGLIDSHLTPGQEVWIVNNTLCGLLDSADLVQQKQSIDVNNAVKSTVYVANNIADTINSCENFDGYQEHNHAANAQYGNPGLYGASFGANDFTCSRPATSWTSNKTPQATLLISDDSAGSNPIDFNTIGVIWERLPSISDMSNLRIDWASVANPTPFESLPYSTAWSSVYFLEDLR